MGAYWSCHSERWRFRINAYSAEHKIYDYKLIFIEPGFHLGSCTVLKVTVLSWCWCDVQYNFCYCNALTNMVYCTPGETAQYSVLYFYWMVWQFHCIDFFWQIFILSCLIRTGGFLTAFVSCAMNRIKRCFLTDAELLYFYLIACDWFVPQKAFD